MNAANTFLPPPREVRAVVQGGFTAPIRCRSPRAANGIVYGQYHAPILEYIFPENVPGTPLPENNFNTIDFLAQGGYSSSAGTLVGQLNPWPSNVVPAITCAAAAANAGGPYAANSGQTIPLSRWRHRNTAHHLCLDGDRWNILECQPADHQLDGAPGSCLDYVQPDAHGHQLRRVFELDHDRDRCRGVGPDRESDPQSVSDFRSGRLVQRNRL